MPLTPTTRCFVALSPSEDTARRLYRAGNKLDLPGIRRVSAEDMHITLKFLGDIEHGEVPRIIEAIQAATDGASPFELEVTRLGCFPRPERPRVLVAHTSLPNALAKLAIDLEESMAEIGFRREARSFNPHITLGRFRKPPRYAPDLFAVDLGRPSFDVNEVVLMESVRRKTGASYARMAAFELG
ncbi:MAG: RNA 2',3'-cyclic phosphodiesterase [Planctomycetota bacterium]|jgi:2'-5' RNA ligase